MPNQNQNISWSAPEFRYYEKNVGWYTAFVATVILVIGFFVIQNDLFAAITVLILGFCLIFFAGHKPEVVDIEMTSKAIHFGSIAYPYKQLKYFWIVNNHHHRTLNLEASTIINNSIIIELMDQDEDEIREFLLQHLPEHHETSETFAQKISHKLKF